MTHKNLVAFPLFRATIRELNAVKRRMKETEKKIKQQIHFLKTTQSSKPIHLIPRDVGENYYSVGSGKTVVILQDPLKPYTICVSGRIAATGFECRQQGNALLILWGHDKDELVIENYFSFGSVFPHIGVYGNTVGYLHHATTLPKDLKLQTQTSPTSKSKKPKK